MVSSHFNLKEKEYFGLTFVDDKYVKSYNIDLRIPVSLTLNVS